MPRMVLSSGTENKRSIRYSRCFSIWLTHLPGLTKPVSYLNAKCMDRAFQKVMGLCERQGVHLKYLKCAQMVYTASK